MAHSPGSSSTSQYQAGRTAGSARFSVPPDTPHEGPWSSLRGAVAGRRDPVGRRLGPIGRTAPAGATQNRLAEAGRRWARAHQSASLMRARLGDLEASMETELRTASEADRMAYYRAWRTVSDAATWTSLTQLEEAALLDPLTGVGNRRALDLMLSRATSVAQRAGSELAVVAVDLDGLKRINDSQGHAEGDRTLTSLVDAFGERLRGSDTVFRTGGDEFAVVLPGMRLGDVEALMHRISAAGAPGFTWGPRRSTSSINAPSDLLDAADTISTAVEEWSGRRSEPVPVKAPTGVRNRAWVRGPPSWASTAPTGRAGPGSRTGPAWRWPPAWWPSPEPSGR